MKPLETATVSDLQKLLNLIQQSLETVAPLLDDLNALNGADFDTGSNALHTIKTINQQINDTPTQNTHAATTTFLNACTTYARVNGRGHIGILLANLFDALAKNTQNNELRPIDLRRFLKNLPTTITTCFTTPDTSLNAIAAAAAETANHTPDPITNVQLLIGEASMEIQSTLIETTTGWINPGAATLTIFTAALHALYDGHTGPLDTTLEMISHLAQTASKRPLPANQPREGAEYSVDLQLDCMEEDYKNYCKNLEKHKVRYSKQGSTDLLGMGSWRFHLDTSNPLNVIPNFGWVRNIIIKDARYGELLGQDELAVQQETSGVLYLSRPTWQRPDTVRVIALVKHRELIEEIASTGAWIIYNPTPEDTPIISSLLTDAPGKTALILPSDPNSKEIAQRAQNQATQKLNGDLTVIYPPQPYSDGISSIIAATAAPTFMPEVGEKTPQITQQLLTNTTQASLRRCALVTETNPTQIKEQLTQLIGYGLSRILLFAPANEQQILRDTIHEALETRHQTGHYVETITSNTPQILLING